MPDRFYDNTRLSAYKTCPRYFYFRHELDWTGEGTRYPLSWGGAWHEAMDHVWTAMCEYKSTDLDRVADEAYQEFLSKWCEDGQTHPDDASLEQADAWKVHNPNYAADMLHEYVRARQGFFKRIKLLEVEKPFAVPLDPEQPDLFYVGRMDKVFEMDGDIYVAEHKTTSLYAKAGGFRVGFLDSFSPNSQIDGYLYAGHVEYGDRFKAVWIDAALKHKHVHDAFKFIPVERQFAQLDAWLWEAHYWVDQVERNRDAAELRDGPYMAAWPKNTNSCVDFGQACQFQGLCKSFSNPAVAEKPMDMVVDHWSPFEELELNKIGLEKTDDTV